MRFTNGVLDLGINFRNLGLMFRKLMKLKFFVTVLP